MQPVGSGVAAQQTSKWCQTTFAEVAGATACSSRHKSRYPSSRVHLSTLEHAFHGKNRGHTRVAEGDPHTDLGALRPRAMQRRQTQRILKVDFGERRERMNVPAHASATPHPIRSHAHVHVPRVVCPHVCEVHSALEPERLPPAHALQRERERVVHEFPCRRIRARCRRGVLQRGYVAVW